MAIRNISTAMAVAAYVAIAPAPVVRAEQVWLTDSEIVAALKNTTLVGAYASGRAFTETYRVDGRVAYIETDFETNGRWSVMAGTLCTIYDTDPAGGCFRVSKAGLNCYEFYFATRTEAELPLPDDAQPSWTARGSVTGKPGSCAEDASV